MLESSQRYCKSLSSVLLLHLNRKSPNAELVNTMLDTTISGLKEDEHPIVHSDRGCHYRRPGWIQRMEKTILYDQCLKKDVHQIIRLVKDFFRCLKNEMFYKRDWKGITINEFIEMVNNYITWNNNDRIKQSLGYKSPFEYRRELGLI